MRVNPASSKASKVLPEMPIVWIPYIKVSPKRLPNGEREWTLSWRPATGDDLRDIWNGDVSLDKKARRSSRK